MSLLFRPSLDPPKSFLVTPTTGISSSTRDSELIVTTGVEAALSHL